MGTSGPLTDGIPVIILFDGVCNLCNGVVQFLIKRDPEAKFRFASLQSVFGKAQLLKFNMDPETLHSVVVVHNGNAFQKSDAVIYISRYLSWPWRIVASFRWLPKRFRDALYDLIAGSRYKLFGRRESCMIPTADLRGRFLE